MITLTAEIKIHDGGEPIKNVSITPSNNNISSDISSVLGVEKKAIRPFLVSSSGIDVMETVENRVDYFIGSVVSSSTKQFSTPYILTTNGSCEEITIVFDEANIQYPTSITVDGTIYEYERNDCKYVVKVGTTESTHTIVIDNWSVANEPLVITGIYSSLSYVADYSSLTDIEGQHKDRANTSMPSYGIYSNSGSMSVNDAKGILKNYIESRIIKQGMPLTITLEDTLSGLKQVVGQYITTDWDYDYINKVATCTIKDNLEELQNINLNVVPYQSFVGSTGKDLYNMMKSQTPSRFKFVSYDNLNDATKQKLEKLKLANLYIDGSSTWARWSDFCLAMQSHIYSDYNGNTTFEVE